MNVGPIDLLVIQATSFCNLDCKYCYLPDRLNKSRIEIKTVELILDRIFQSNLIGKDFSILWHAGEPTVVPVSFYRTVAKILEKKNNTKFKVRQNFQTNATLINQEWCEFFLDQKEKINIAVSIDGPEFIHNNQRVNRKGAGTFDATMKGVSLLQQNKIDFGIISVITDYTLDYPEEFYNFFRALNPRILGLNVEEVEGANLSSSLYKRNISPDRFASFMSKLYSFYERDGRVLQIREFQQLERFILASSNFRDKLSQQTIPLRILTIDTKGNFTTFSPELLTMSHPKYDNFILGNIFENSFESILKSAKFSAMYSEILEGILMCKKECNYFQVCGGGVPSNKFSENKTFKSTITNHCKFKFQWLFDTILNNLERSILQDSITLNS